MAKSKIDVSKLLGAKPKIKIPKSQPKQIENAVEKIHVPKVQKLKPKSKKEIKKKEIVRLSLDIPKKLHTDFKILAIQKGTNMKELILEFMQSEIRK